MEAYQERVITEKAELDLKIERLNLFIQGKMFVTLPFQERDLLVTQSAAMRDYSICLGERIRRFKGGT
jgi:hypothetical protein